MISILAGNLNLCHSYLIICNCNYKQGVVLPEMTDTERNWSFEESVFIAILNEKR